MHNSKLKKSNPGLGDVVGFFRAQLATNGGKVALASEDITISYQELNHASDVLACEIDKRLGACDRERPVAFCFSRSIESVVAILGILKSGHPYLPLGLRLDDREVNLQLENSRTALLIVTSETADRFQQHATLELKLSSLLQGTNVLSSVVDIKPTDPAYIMFTSGSTGVPKAVLVPHQGITRLVINTDYVSFREKEIIPCLSPLSFDASTFEIWGALLNGGTLLFPAAEKLSLHDIAEFIANNGVTTLWLTAGLFNALVDKELHLLGTVRQLLTGGEAMSSTHAERFLKAHPHVALINGYGPTENTTFSTCHRVTPQDFGGRISIGKPIKGSYAFVLNEQQQLLTHGEEGELYVGGYGLAIGYANDSELTKTRFVTLTIDGSGIHRLYRTGDRVILKADHTYDFLGRLDGQVKVRGFRVELSEIETVVIRHKSVQAAAAFTRKMPDGHLRIELAVVPIAITEDINDSIRHYCECSLPEHERPSVIHIVEKLPLNQNGKLDRRALEKDLTSVNTNAKIKCKVATELHSILIEIWEGILPAQNFGLHDSFFKVGGDSLLAMRMLAEVEERTGLRLPIECLLNATTIAEITIAYAEHQARTDQKRITELTSKSSRSLFFCHGDFNGGGLSCRQIAAALEDSFSFYAIRSHGVVEEDRPSNVWEIAKQNVAQILMTHRKDSMWLGGHCNGALVAICMAIILKQKGIKVDGLLLLEPPSFFYPKLRLGIKKGLSWFGISADRSNIITTQLVRSIISSNEVLVRRRTMFSKTFIKSYIRRLDSFRRPLIPVVSYLQMICNDFNWGKCDCRMQVIFVGPGGDSASRLSKIWQAHYSGVECHMIPADHSMMISEGREFICEYWRKFVNERHS